MRLSAVSLIIFVLLALGAAGYRFAHKPMSDFADHSQRLIAVGGVPVQAEVVSTDASRQQGLSGRDDLAPDTGMLFVFEGDGVWGFWMKDMRFSIDIVWADNNGTIVAIDKSVSPDTYPQVFYPPTPARYAVELPAGWAQSHDLAVGQKIVL